MDGRLTPGGGEFSLRIRRMNWSLLGIKLRQRGVGPNRVADILNLPKPTVRGWFNHRREPTWSNGDALCQLFIEITGESPPFM